MDEGCRPPKWPGGDVASDGPPLTFTQACALLCHEGPWHKHSLAEIAELDEYQLINIIFRPGDKQAAEKEVYLPLPTIYVPEESWIKPAAGFEQMWKAVYRDRGMEEYVIERIWQEYLDDNPWLRDDAVMSDWDPE